MTPMSPCLVVDRTMFSSLLFQYASLSSTHLSSGFSEKFSCVRMELLSFLRAYSIPVDGSKALGIASESNRIAVIAMIRYMRWIFKF